MLYGLSRIFYLLRLLLFLHYSDAGIFGNELSGLANGRYAGKNVTTTHIVLSVYVYWDDNIRRIRFRARTITKRSEVRDNFTYESNNSDYNRKTQCVFCKTRARGYNFSSLQSSPSPVGPPSRKSLYCLKYSES